MKEYFSHDYNSRSDKKLISLSMKHGLAGIGAYWCIIEMLFEEVGYISIKEYERIAFELRTDNEFIKSIIEDFDLFIIKDEMFSSESAIGRLKERMDKSEKARESVNARWNKYERNTNVKGTKSDSNTIKVKESKEKYNAFIDLFNEITKKSFRGDKKSEPSFHARLEEGYKYKDFKLAITNAFNDTYLKENPQYLTPSYITRTDQLEKWINAKPTNGISRDQFPQLPTND